MLGGHFQVSFLLFGDQQSFVGMCECFLSLKFSVFFCRDLSWLNLPLENLVTLFKKFLRGPSSCCQQTVVVTWFFLFDFRAGDCTQDLVNAKHAVYY